MNLASNKKRLFWRLYPTYLVISLIAVAAVSGYATTVLREFFLDQTRNDLQIRTRLLERQIAPYLSPLDAAAVDAACKQTGRFTGTRFTVILASGIVVGDTFETPEKMDNHKNRPEIRQAIEQGVGSASRFSDTLRARRMYVAATANTGNAPVIVIRASLSISTIDETLNALRLRIGLGGLLIAIFAFIISYFVAKHISRPIEEMRQGAERFASGDLTYRLPPVSTEELSSLSAALNRMAAQLAEKIKTVIHQRNEYEAVLSSMAEGVIAVDRNERILSANRAAAQMFDSSLQNFQGRLVQEVIRNRDMQAFIGRALAEGGHEGSDICLYKNGKRIVNAYGAPLRDSDESQIGTLIVLNDVTHLRRLENIRRDFAANVSHEIKTPLTAIKGFVETLQHGAVDSPEEGERFLGIISKHVDRLNAIVEDLLALSRIERTDQNQELNLETTRIRNVILNAMQVCQALTESREILIDLNCPTDLTARIDPALFEQAVVNLIDNALKYSPEKSTLWIIATEAENRIQVVFRDQGIGIPKQHQDRLFERFYRVDKARSRRMGGTGLGLAIVKHIVQAHHGRIMLESTPGSGSTFTIQIPGSPASVNKDTIGI